MTRVKLDQGPASKTDECLVLGPRLETGSRLVLQFTQKTT